MLTQIGKKLFYKVFRQSALKALSEYIDSKNEIGMKFFYTPFCTDEEKEAFLKDLGTDARATIVISRLTAESSGQACPQCLQYTLGEDQSCYRCPLKVRTNYCRKHPIIENNDHLTIWRELSDVEGYIPALQKLVNHTKCKI